MASLLNSCLVKKPESAGPILSADDGHLGQNESRTDGVEQGHQTGREVVPGNVWIAFPGECQGLERRVCQR